MNMPPPPPRNPYMEVFSDAAISAFMARQAALPEKVGKAMTTNAWCRWSAGPTYHLWDWHSLISICGVDVRTVPGSGIRCPEPAAAELDRCERCSEILAGRR